MKSGLSMTSRAEVTTRYARSFRAADKRTKGRILDEVVSVTGWSRDNARRRLTSAAQSPPGVVPGPAGHGHHLVQYPALRPLVRGPERPGVPRGDLGTRRHRQPTLHALPRSPLRGHSYVRHGERFAGSFRESRRIVVT